MVKAVADAFRSAGFRSADFGAGRAYYRQNGDKQVLVSPQCDCNAGVPSDPDDPCNVYLETLDGNILSVGSADNPFEAIKVADQMLPRSA